MTVLGNVLFFVSLFCRQEKGGVCGMSLTRQQFSFTTAAIY